MDKSGGKHPSRLPSFHLIFQSILKITREFRPPQSPNWVGWGGGCHCIRFFCIRIIVSVTNNKTINMQLHKLVKGHRASSKATHYPKNSKQCYTSPLTDKKAVLFFLLSFTHLLYTVAISESLLGRRAKECPRFSYF